MTEKLPSLLRNTRDLRAFLLQSLDDLAQKRIDPADARARAWLARSALDTVRIEMIAAAQGRRTFDAIPLAGPSVDQSNTVIEGEISGADKNA